MADLRRTAPVTCPVAAGVVVTICIDPTIWLGTSQDIVLIRRIADAIHWFSRFGERDHLADSIPKSRLFDRITMQPSEVSGYLAPATVSEPGTTSDPIAGIDCTRALRTKIRSPRSTSATDRRRQGLTMCIGTLEPTKVSAVARPPTGAPT